MKRREFLKTTALGTAGGLVAGALRPSETRGTAANVQTHAGEPVTEICTLSQTARSGIALGGIGAGFVELRKNGKYVNWNIFNNKPKETGPRCELASGEHENPEDSMFFFIVRYEVEGEEPRKKLLQISEGLGEGAMTGVIYYHPWLSPVEKIEYQGRFPFVNMKFTDPDMPLIVELEAFTPFIPHDVKNSSLPGVFFNVNVTSICKKPVDVMIMATLRNNVGYDYPKRYFVTELKEDEKYKLCSMTCGGMDKSASSYGTQVLASLSPESCYYLGWEHRHPYYEIVLREKVLPNIDDTAGRNHSDRGTGEKRVNLTQQGDARLFSTMARSSELAPKQSLQYSFVMSWYFPNLYAGNKGGMKERIEGHYYNNFFENASEVADYMIQNKEELTARTRNFVNDFYDSSAPQFVLDQVNSQLNTFITSGRLVKSGDFGVQEGMAPSQSWGPVATIDVMMYGSVPVLALFPELQKATMRAHKRHQSPKGEIAHGLHKDFEQLEDGTAGVYHRLDLPGQYVLMTLRDFFWSNDRKYLEEMWSSVKKAIDYILNERDFDGNSLPSMKGIECSYDNFPMYGMASYIVSQWLAAMASAVQAAEVLGDQSAKMKYASIMQKGSRLMDQKLWNGKYYRLYNDEGGEHGGKDEGCLTDQIVGQWVARLSGLGDILKKEHVKQALKSILNMSYQQNFGLRNCSWPGDKYWHDIPENIWVDQANTCWTGVELAFASFLIFEGLYDEGLQVIKTVDDRYRRTGLYWDHQEFGGHYFRPMSAWAILNAMLGLKINQGTYSFDPKLTDKNLKLFFAYPDGTAHYVRNVTANDERYEIDVRSGQFNCNQLIFSKINPQYKTVKIFLNNSDISHQINDIDVDKQKMNIQLNGTLKVKASEKLTVVVS